MRLQLKTLTASAAVGALGVLTGLALGSGHSPAAVDTRVKQPVEVRTQVIRRTVHVYRHAKPRPAPAAGTSPAGTSAALAAAAPATRSSGSAAHPVGAAAAPVTRTSGAASHSGPAAPVRTHTSGAGGGGSSPGRVTTRSSGGHGDDSSKHDD